MRHVRRSRSGSAQDAAIRIGGAMPRVTTMREVRYEPCRGDKTASTIDTNRVIDGERQTI